MINPWKVLGVHRKSTDEEIQEAFHKQARKYHPDMKKGNEDKFKLFNEAYQMIKTKSLRRVLLDKTLGNCAECSKCAGAGVTTKSKGLTGKIYSACNGCGGSGLIIKETENENVVIELHGTSGAGRKGRNNKH